MALLILFSFALIVWGYFFKYLHVRKYSSIIPNADSSDAASLNGCGTSILGGFQIQNSEMKVYYVTLTVLFLPILPIGAVVAKRIGANSAFLGFDTKYSVYGKTNSSLKEILSCYALRWGIALFVLSILVNDSSFNSVWNDIRRLTDRIFDSGLLWFPIVLIVVVVALFADKFEKYYKNQGNNVKNEQCSQLEDITEIVKSKFDILYCWVPMYCIDNILRDGLLPKHQKDACDHISRIYLMDGNSTDKYMLHIGQLLCYANKNPNNNGDYSLLRIDIEDIDDCIRFYNDPHDMFGFFTEQSISTDRIQVDHAVRFLKN